MFQRNEIDLFQHYIFLSWTPISVVFLEYMPHFRKRKMFLNQRKYSRATCERM